MANPTVTFETTHGTFKAEMFEDEAPATAGNFIKLARDGFYDGIVFHRVIEGFMIQGGDPTGTGRGGPGYQIDDEFAPGLKHTARRHLLHGQRRAEHRRIAVLHHAGGDAVARRQARHLRQGRRGDGRGAGDRQGRDRTDGPPPRRTS
jgi:cyclophilin family peptidyl-prolyl cis-trans isomerase